MQNTESREIAKVETIDVEGAPQIRLMGECDISTVPCLQEHLLAMVDAGRNRVIFNLEHATFLDSSILRIFLSAHRRLNVDGGEVILLCRPGFVRRLLYLLEMDRVLQVLTPEEWRDRIAAVN